MIDDETTNGSLVPGSPPDRDELLTLDEVCERLKISPATMYRLLAAKELPTGHRLGSRRRWYASEIDAAVKSRCSQPSPDESTDVDGDAA